MDSIIVFIIDSYIAETNATYFLKILMS